MTPTIQFDPAADAAHIRFSGEAVLESEEVSMASFLIMTRTSGLSAWKSTRRASTCRRQC